MALRSIRSTVTFPRPFTLSGYSDELPAGEYEVLVEEELIETLSFPGLPQNSDFPDYKRQGAFAGPNRNAANYLDRPGKRHLAAAFNMTPEDSEAALCRWRNYNEHSRMA